MNTVSPKSPTVTAILQAALLLVALPFLEVLGLPRPNAEEVLSKLGVSRSYAYEMRNRLLGLFPMLQKPTGRPSKPEMPAPDTGEISRKVIAFLQTHPGAARATRTRNSYSDDFRRCVLDLAEQHAGIDRAELALAVGVPFDTFRDWLDAPPPKPIVSPKVDEDVTQARVASILEAWPSWRGGFISFCTFVRTELLIDYGWALIRRILETHADRRLKPRPGRSPDEKATREALVSFFPGAQWFEDGSPISIVLKGKTFTFNWELVVDGYSSAFVGATLSKEETGAAVVEAFKNGVDTTGAKPIALNTDNKAPNHTAEVDKALEESVHIRATLGRPQNDAPVEGAFGLFQQTAPPLVVKGDSDEELAQGFLKLILDVWGRATNHRPRSNRKGKSRVQLYSDVKPTEAQIAGAKMQLEERRRRQELAQLTRTARLNPVVRSMLDEAFVRLRLEDPTGNIKDAIARYSAEVVLAAIATFEAKRDKNTLPIDVGARYLLGIARRISERDEGYAIAELLWLRRLELEDRAIQELEMARKAIVGDVPARIGETIKRAVQANGTLQRTFWLTAAANLIKEASIEGRKALYDLAVRRVHAAFDIDPWERQAAVRVLAARTLPIV